MDNFFLPKTFENDSFWCANKQDKYGVSQELVCHPINTGLKRKEVNFSECQHPILSIFAAIQATAKETANLSLEMSAKLLLLRRRLLTYLLYLD